MAGESLRKIAEGREAEIFAWGDHAVLRLLRNPSDRGGKAMEYFSQALRLARRMASPSFALRAALSMARLHWQKQDRAAARRVVAAAHASIADGVDTPDLREASQFLDGTGPRAASE